MNATLTSLQTRLRAAVSAVTGHRPEDLDPELFLESDLGVDSIKMVELSQSLLKLVPDALQERFAAAVPMNQLIQVQTLRELEAIFEGWDDAPAPVAEALPIDAAPRVADDPLERRVLALISGITGHDPRDLDLESFLESDLGVDSIKMVELSQGLLLLVPEARREAFLATVPADQLMQLQTLADIVRLFEPWQQAATARIEASLDRADAACATARLHIPADIEPLPLLPSQYPFLVSQWAVSTCSLVSRVRLRGPFDMATAHGCWTALLARHPALRSRFTIDNGATSFAGYRYQIASIVDAPELAVTDLQALDSARQEAAIADAVEAAVNHAWTLQEPLLHRFHVLRLAHDVHEVFFTNHHLVSDGLGNQQVMREFIALYEAAATGRLAALSPATPVQYYRETVEAIAASHDPRDDAALAELLRRQGRQAYTWNPRGAPRAAHRAKVANKRFRLDAVATTALVRLTGELKVSMNTLLVGAYLRTVAQCDDGQNSGPIILNVPTAGRLYPGVDATGIVGCFAQNLALDFARPAADEAWITLLQRVQATVDSAVSQGCDRAQTRQAAAMIRDKVKLVDGRIPESHAGLIRAGMKSNLFLPYIGNTRIAETCGPLQVIDYQAATVTNAGTLDTVIEQFHGRLEMTTNYDANHFDAALVAQVGDAFVAQLQSLARLQVAATVPVAPSMSAPDSRHRDLVRQVAEEVMHRAVSTADFGLDLEADLGLDSLERIRIVSRLVRFATGADRQRLLAGRRLADMVAELDGPIEASTPQPAYRQIARQCAATPDAIAVWSPRASLSYGELHAQSNRLARRLQGLGVTRGSRVGLMLERGPNLLVGLLAIMKAGGAYVPLDPDYPTARLRYMLEHAGIGVLLTEAAVEAPLAACLREPLPRLRSLVYLDEPSTASVPVDACTRIGRADWSTEPADDLPPIAGADDPMVVLYTSGSSGQPKGVLLGHGGYANRLEWHQGLFRLQPGERVALKTSVCFDISVWELLWPLQHGGTVCPVDAATLRDPWALAQWIVDSDIRVMHFVPSLFGEFVAAVEPQRIAFPRLRQLVFSGEALPAPLVRRWFARFGLGAALANLYGPTEASIDVSAWQMTQMPPLSLARIPIGLAMPNVHLLVLDDAMQRVPAGTQGELWIGGVQLAQGYLADPRRTAESFRPNPFDDIDCRVLYRTGDLCVQLPDGSFDYRGRCDSQVKIRGFRVELGEIEAVLATHPAVREAAVMALDPGDGHLRLAAWLAGDANAPRPEPRELREHLGQRLPAYMLPSTFAWRDRLPKNQNGKLDRKALLQAPQVAEPPHAVHGADPVVEPVDGPDERVVSNAIEFPMGPAQHWLLKYFDAPHQWAGYSRFRYLQPLDVTLFNHALKRLTQRHAALRTVFQQHGATWHQRFPEPAQWPQAEVYDGTHLDAASRNEHLQALIADRVAGLRLDGNGPLWHVIVIKEAEDRYDICMLGHHMISDMLANGTLFKSMWQLYGECLARADNDRDGDDKAEWPSFVAYLGALEKFRTRDQVARHVDYWTQRFPASRPAFAVPMDHRLGDNVEASEAAETFLLGADDTAALQRARARHGCSLYTVLLAPLYRVMAEWSGNADVVLSQRSHGRDFGDGCTWFDCVGNFAVNYPVGVTVDAQAGWDAAVQSIKHAFEHVPMNGISYDLVADRLPTHLYPDHKLTPVRVNYLGRRSLPRSRLFEFDGDDWDQRYSLPGQKRSALIEVFFIATDGALQLRLSYSKNFHSAATLRALGERYLALTRDMTAQASTAPAVPIADTSPGALHPIVSQLIEATRPLPAPEARGPLAGKVAVVTGAGRGIGRSIAVKLAAQGASVALVSRSQGPLDEALAEVLQHGGEAVAIRADVTSQAEVEAMMKQVVARFGGIDILVNNAGANRSSMLTESEPADWRAVVDLNLMSTYLCCRSAVPHMVSRGGGRIVNLGSAASVIGYPLFSAYCASKHAVVGLTKALAEEVKHDGIQVNVVCPAFVDTRMTPQAFRSVSMPTDQVADVVLFLASPAGSGVTGESINIFGRQDMYAYGSDKMGLVKAMTKDFRPGVTA